MTCPSNAFSAEKFGLSSVTGSKRAQAAAPYLVKLWSLSLVTQPLKDRLNFTRLQPLRKVILLQKTKICNNRGTRSSVDAIQHIRINAMPAVGSLANWEGKEQREDFLKD